MPCARLRTTAAVSTGKLADAGQSEQAASARLGVELRDAFDEGRAVREVEIVDAERERGLHDAGRDRCHRPERPADVDHDAGRKRAQLLRDIAVAVEDEPACTSPPDEGSRKSVSALARERPAMSSVSRGSSARSCASRPPKVP